MERSWLTVLVLACAATASAETRHEVDLGIVAEHVSGGRTDSGNGFVGYSGAAIATALQLEAGQIMQPERTISVVIREMIGGVLRGPQVLHNYLVVGARAQPFRAGFIELMVGGGLQIGQSSSPDVGSNIVFTATGVLRVGARTGRWGLVVEAFVVPTALGEFGLADYGAGLLGSRAFGD